MPKLPEMAKQVTLRQWAEANGYPLATVRAWSKNQPDFPEAVEITPPIHWYVESQLNRWKRRHPKLGLGRGGNMRPIDPPA